MVTLYEHICPAEVRHLVAQRLIDMSYLLGELPSTSRNFH
jgi:error-prone DNA polymerase